MKTKTGPNGSAARHVKEIKRKTRRKFSAEVRIRIVLDGVRGKSHSGRQMLTLVGEVRLRPQQQRTTIGT
jgi:transposase-like protein